LLGLGCYAAFNASVTLAQAPAGRVDPAVATTRGCRTGGLFRRNEADPHWVSVHDEDNRAAEGVVRESLISFEDLPLDHDSHDVNFDVKLDDAYDDLNSSANQVNDHRETVMEMEWESKYFPLAFWPVVDDRAWVVGRWIFDCGHPPARSEIHPPLATAFTRLEPAAFTGDAVPSLTTKTFVYIHGRGGYYSSARPVATRDYEFDIVVPPRPSQSAELRAEILSLPYGGPAIRPLLSVQSGHVHVRYPLAAINDPSPDRKFGAVILAGWREPRLTRGYRKLRITLDNVRINTRHATLAEAEWQLWVLTGNRWIETLRTHDAPGLPVPTPETGNVRDRDVVAIRKSSEIVVPDDGSLPVRIQTTGWESNSIDRRFGARPNGVRDLRIADIGGLLNNNAPLGVVAKAYSAAEKFGIGVHDDLSERNPLATTSAKTNGDFNLRYHIEQIAVYPAGTMNSGGLRHGGRPGVRARGISPAP
jgi:hypothetical protein